MAAVAVMVKGTAIEGRKENITEFSEKSEFPVAQKAREVLEL